MAEFEPIEKVSRWWSQRGGGVELGQKIPEKHALCWRNLVALELRPDKPIFILGDHVKTIGHRGLGCTILSVYTQKKTSQIEPFSIPNDGLLLRYLKQNKKLKIKTKSNMKRVSEEFSHYFSEVICTMNILSLSNRCNN
jgi:hypothetical protein